MKRVSSCTVIERAPASTGRSHSGSSGCSVGHSSDPEVGVDQVDQLVDGLDLAGHRLDGAVGVDEDEHRAAAIIG